MSEQKYTPGALRAARIIGYGLAFEEKDIAESISRETHDKELLEALRALVNEPIVQGMSARIRDDAKREGRPNPLKQAEAAIRKATEGEE